MAKNKRKRNELDEDLQEEDMLDVENVKNYEYGMSKLSDQTKVKVLYKGYNFRIKITIPKSNIQGKAYKAKNNMFELYIKFDRNLEKKKHGKIIVIIDRKYDKKVLKKSPYECTAIKVGIKSDTYHGTIIIQPQLYIPYIWSPEVKTVISI